MSKLVKIIAFTYPHEAHLAKGLLESSNVKVIIKDEYTVQVHNFLSNAIGGVKLFVEENDVENAISILKENEYIKPQYHKPKIKLEKFPSEYKGKCPYCESTDVIKNKNYNYAILAIMLFGLPIPFYKKKYFCFDCNNEWIVRK
jgi:hypothetical protein